MNNVRESCYQVSIETVYQVYIEGENNNPYQRPLGMEIRDSDFEQHQFQINHQHHDESGFNVGGGYDNNQSLYENQQHLYNSEKASVPATPPAPLAIQYEPDKKERTFMGSVKDEDSEAMVVVPTTTKGTRAAKQNKIVDMFQEDDLMIARAKKLQKDH